MNDNTITVDIFYFDPEVSGFPFLPSHDELVALPRRKVASYETTSEDVFEEAFAKFNRGSGREDPQLDELRLRSLSVGDAVVVRDTNVAAFCASRGWDRVNPEVITGEYDPEQAYADAESYVETKRGNA